MVRFLGKGTAPLPPDPSIASAPNGAANAALPAPAAAARPATPVPPASGGDEMRAQILSRVRQETAAREAASAGQAIVALPDRAQASAIASTLTRLGFSVEAMDDTAEATR